MSRIAAIGVVVLAAVLAGSRPLVADERPVRFATYNVSLYRERSGELAEDLAGGACRQAQQIAEVIQRVRPDVLLLNEFDYDAASRAAELFRTNYLQVGQGGRPPIEYAHYFSAPVNTGRPSGRDLDQDGRLGGPADAVGFGRHEGQYGMLVLSRLSIDRPRVRTFQEFRWRDMPGARLPRDPQTGQPFYDADDLAALRLSSKSFWDLPILLGETDDSVVHLLCSHPTPPVFDGPEDRNGCRNYDEIRMLVDYVDPDRGGYLVDDRGRRGGLADDARFVIAGDLNSDPVDGQGVPGAIKQLLEHPRVNSSEIPESEGGARVVRRFAGQNALRRGDPRHVTADFTSEGHGNLRVDYVLPSKGLRVVGSGVFWPRPEQPGEEAVAASDHRLVWLDLAPSNSTVPFDAGAVR